MRAARPCIQSEMDHLLMSGGLPDWDYISVQDGECPFEPKASDWGYVGDQLVALDYSTPAHMTAEEKIAENNCTTWDS